MSGLPEGWVTTEFDKVLFSLSNGIGGKQNKEGNGLPVSRIETIANENFDFSRIGYIENYDESKIAKYKLSKGEILFSHINSAIHLGKTALFYSDKDLYHGVNLLRIIVNTSVVPEYFNYYCKYIRALGGFSSIAQHAVNQASINQKKLKQCQITLAPLNEQIRIANKLDSLLGKLQATQKRLDKIPTLLKRYRQSVLAAAVSGELTKEWQGNRKSEWTKINFNELIEDSANGLSKRKGDTGEPIVVLRLADFKNGKRKKGVERKIQLNDKERNKYALKCDDILVIRVNGSVDLAGLFIRYESNIEEIYCDHFIRFRLDKNLIDSDFMTYVANSGEGRRYLKSKLSTSAGQNTINQTSIKSLSFLLPKVEEQKQIVKRVEALFKLADQAEQHYQAAKQRTDKLTQSILAKAFRGELVPQDPNDEPASELLARIQAEKDK